ncbi:MAG: hypothetical protein ACRC28_06360 [Clostridium sp.]|uniref:hypothetical protein n=1 Tax=Clostridium sp. TaxID=1506 RepID=UPI003F3E48BD
MKKISLKKGIVIGIIIVAIVVIISVIAAFISIVNNKEKALDGSNYKNSYQYKMQREKSLKVLQGFYGNYIVTDISGTSPTIGLSDSDLNTLKNDMIGSKVVLGEENFSITYNDTKQVNLVNFSNVNINKPYYEVNSTDESMFQSIYGTSLSSVGIKSSTPYFINVGGNSNYEQEIIQNGEGGLLIYSQGAFFKLEPETKVLAERNAQLEKLANDALKVGTGNEYKYVFPVEQIQKDGKFEYKNSDSSMIFMCKEKDNSVVPDKDTMFITLSKGDVTPVDKTKDNTDNKDNKDNKDKNNTTENPNKQIEDKNAGKPFYNFTINTLGQMNQTAGGKPVVGKVYLNGDVVVGN